MELEHIAVVFMDYIFRFRCPYTSSDRFLHHSTQCFGIASGCVVLPAELYCISPCMDESTGHDGASAATCAAETV